MIDRLLRRFQSISADILSIPWFSFGCSTDHSTASSMVIAHKVRRFTGKASLYAWNSLIPEDVSSDSVHLLRLTCINAIDLVADIVESYSSFPGLVGLIVPPGVILPYGSLSRRPDDPSPLVCTYSLILLFTKVASSAPYIVHGVAAWRYLASSYVFSETDRKFF
ncbi:unnamed protein product [Arabis nemorensis]|uniref:Uncharacterized protein n=1 Tax=Arabis nemorensis TaxID=586526 RepID=A0A565CLT6_9BRAS|nr:unnamed protein product [Arabis nemorensis]